MTRETFNATLEAEVSGVAPTLDLFAPYREIARSGIGVAMELEDDKVDVQEVDDLDLLLADLGFEGARNPSAAVPLGSTGIRFALRVALGTESLSQLTSELDEADWNLDFRRAARRWLETVAISNQLKFDGTSRSDVLRALLADPTFVEVFDREGVPGIETFLRDGFTVSKLGVGGKTKKFAMTQGDAKSLGLTLLPLRVSSGAGLRALARFGESWAAAKSGLSPAQMARATADFSRFAYRVTPRLEDNPTLGIWVILARLQRLGASSLAKAEGFATLRWREAATEEWSTPEIWKLHRLTLTRGAGSVFDGAVVG